MSNSLIFSMKCIDCQSEKKTIRLGISCTWIWVYLYVCLCVCTALFYVFRRFSIFRECRVLRARAIDVGHRVSNADEKCCQLEACKKYRACVQKERREHKNKCLAEIEAPYTVDRNNLWKVIYRLSGSKSAATEPSDSEFFDHFNQLSNG